MENQDLIDHVKAIANDIQHGLECQYCEECGEYHEDATICPTCEQPTVSNTMDGMSYLSDALDIEYTVASDKRTMLGARILVAFGGPNIWIDTKRGEVEGYWGGDSATAHFTKDHMGVEMAASDLFWS